MTTNLEESIDGGVLEVIVVGENASQVLNQSQRSDRRERTGEDVAAAAAKEEEEEEKNGIAKLCIEDVKLQGLIALGSFGGGGTQQTRFCLLF